MEPLTGTTVPGLVVSPYINGGIAQPAGFIGLHPRINCVSNLSKVPKDDFETQFLRVLQKLYATIEKNEVHFI